MNNAEKFKLLFDIYATELWSMSEADFLKWLNEDVPDANVCDTISRQAAIDAVQQHREDVLGGYEYDEGVAFVYAAAHNHITDVIKQLPSIQPERKTGHWIPVSNGRGGHQCDRCGCYAPSYQSGTEWLSKFCPECNADMRGEQE